MSVYRVTAEDAKQRTALIGCLCANTIASGTVTEGTKITNSGSFYF
jgi:hypothetical protein